MRKIFSLAALLTLFACSNSTEVGIATAGHAFVDVSVVSMLSESATDHQTVLIAEGIVQAVGPIDEVSVPRGFEVIDGVGGFLAPGLADMHAHPMTERDLHVYAANGVTFIRSMWGEEAVLELRTGVEAGEILGPRIFTGGRIVDGRPIIHYGSDQVLTPEDAERVVAAHKAAGYDFIKVYSNLTREAFDAIAAAARAHDIPFEGHIPGAVAAEHAFASGMRAYEHLIGISSATLEEGARHTWRFAPDFARYATAIGAGEITLEDQFDPARLAALAAAAREHGIWTVPTLVTLRGTALSPAKEAVEMARPGFEYVDYTVKSFWRMGSSFRFGWNEDTYRGAELLFEQELAQVKAFSDAGAGILLGTDAQNPWAMTGFGVADELELLVDAGLSNFAALQSATTSPAEYMGEVGLTGVVAEGARADLVLLGANPLDDVGAYRDIRGVMLAGRWADREALDALLADAKAQSDWKSAFFADAPPWPLEEGEQPAITAEFVLLRGETVVGKERIAMTQSPNGPGIVGQRFDADGAAQDHRPILNDGAPVLTGTALDWLSIAPLVAGLGDYETREIDVYVKAVGDDIESARLTITRQPSEVLVGHFYFTGANRHDVTITSSLGDQTIEVWLGGGFYAGWPVKLLVHDGVEPLEYRRIL